MTAHSAWLVTDGRVLASANIANDHATRRKGLVGQTHIEGAFVIPNCRWVHTFGMRVPIDVAYLDAKMQVIKIQQIKPLRLAMPVPKAKHVLEASAGTFENWGLAVGHTLEARRT